MSSTVTGADAPQQSRFRADRPPALPAFWPDVVATDLDRTFSNEDLTLAPQAVAAVARLRGAGVRCVLATGRSLRELGLRPPLADTFDVYVLEGGSVWGTPGDLRQAPPAAVAPVWQAADALEALGAAVTRRTASFSAPRNREAEVRALGLPLSVQPNRGDVDVLPAGLDKGTGLRAALRLLPGAAPRVLAIGDGENDLPLLRAAQARVAVANAAPALQAAAHAVTSRPAAAGFVEAADWILAGHP